MAKYFISIAYKRRYNDSDVPYLIDSDIWEADEMNYDELENFKYEWRLSHSGTSDVTVISWQRFESDEKCSKKEDKVEDFIKQKIDYLGELASIETNEGRWRAEEKYLYAISVLEEVVEYMNMSEGGEDEVSD